MKCISAIHAQSGSYLAIVTDWLFFELVYLTHITLGHRLLFADIPRLHKPKRVRGDIFMSWVLVDLHSSFRMTERKIIYGPFFLLNMFVSWNELPIEEETRGETNESTKKNKRHSI